MSGQKIIMWLGTTSGQEKWRVEVLRNNGEGDYSLLLGSESADFPVDVGNFGPFEEDLLIHALKDAYPGADIRLKF